LVGKLWTGLGCDKLEAVVDAGLVVGEDGKPVGKHDEELSALSS